MSEKSRPDDADTRDIPSLGYCATCLTEGTWLRAKALYAGTSLCAEHLVRTAETSEVAKDHAPGNENPRDVAIKQLRQEMRGTSGLQLGF